MYGNHVVGNLRILCRVALYTSQNGMISALDACLRQMAKSSQAFCTVIGGKVLATSSVSVNEISFCWQSTVGPISPDQDICIAGDGMVHCHS